MSDRLEIPAGEYGLVRVFTIDLPLKDAEPLMDNDGAGMKIRTGADALDTDHIDLFDMNDLSGMALAEYLMDGHGIPDEELAPHRGQLDRIRGRVIVMRSAAFEGVGQNLTISSPLRWIATFGEDRDKVPLEKIRADTARGAIADGPVESAPRGGRLNAGPIVGGVVAVMALALILWVLL